MGAPFTLVSWNILQGLHYSGGRKRAVPNRDIEDHIARLDADVLVLPEAWRFGLLPGTWAEDLARTFGYELHQWVADRPSRQRERVPWRIVIMTRIPARRLADRLLPEQKPFGQRAVVRVQLLESGLVLAGAHLYGIHYLLQRQPRSWLRERAAFREAIVGSDIVAGDMNMWGPVVRRDAKGMASAVKGRTYRSDRLHSQIDHILINDRVQVLDGHVLPNMGSDHLGLRATLQPRT